MKKEYDKSYWTYQQKIGDFGGWANLTKFSHFLRESDTILDFGCGGGFLLRQLPQAKKFGLEINPHARHVANGFGIKTYETVEAIPEGEFDVIISNHALEHCERPLDEIRSLVPKLKPQGRMIFYVPSETAKRGYRGDDPNQHIYTWSPQNLGNLFTSAGLTIVEVKPFNHSWPPKYRLIAKIGGRFGFNLACYIYGFMIKSIRTQVLIVAERSD